ncbi:MAG: lamin tail domain-containing protein [Deltaproteobacteria bacterium]|nr:MAG: lamin tail domain-containing protein [Deltaproteobacteria bacterium]
MTMLLVLAGLRAALAQDVLINEFLYDPDGSDSGNEWIELCNRGSWPVDLTGWGFEVAGTSFTNIFVFPAQTIEPGEYLLVGAGSDLVLDGTLQNGGSATDGLRLVDDGGVVVDTVLYDEPNTAGLLDDAGSVGTEFAPAAGSGESLARIPDCQDSGDVSLDFSVDSSPTPGAANVLDGGGAGETCDTAVVINEFLADPAGSDSGAEWVELYNPGTDDVDLSGWKLEYGASSYSGHATIPDGTIIPAGSWLVIGGELVDEAEIILSLSMGNASEGADGLRLVCADGAVADIVIYGESNDEGWTNEAGELSTVAPAAPSGASLGRDPDGVDTDDSAADFVAFDYASPGSANGGEGPGCPGQDDVKINELLTNPSGSDDDKEWIELYNRSDVPVDLTGWALQYGTSSFSSTVDLPAGTVIDPGGYLVVGGKKSGVADVIASLSLGNASSSADAVRLVHCGPGTADTVVYGDDNSDEWKDDSGEIADSLAPAPGEDASIQRLSDGYDTDLCGDDFVEQVAPTPGAANPEVEPSVCEGGARTIKINELLPDPAGSDSEVDMEWLELYNAGNEAQRLDGWVIETGTSSWGEDFVFPGGVELAPGEFLVVGNPAVPVADYAASSLSLGNASKAPDGVRIVDCEGSVQDTVLWAKDGAEIEDLELLDDLGFQEVAPMPEEDGSIGRIPDGADTDDCSADFVWTTPTPGYENAEDASGGGGGVEPTGCGGKSTTGGKKCAVVSPIGGLQWLLLAVVAWRRREA